MPFKKVMKGVPTDQVPAEGLMSRNLDTLTSCQIECTARIGKSLQLEQEHYLLRHPEVSVSSTLYEELAGIILLQKCHEMACVEYELLMFSSKSPYNCYKELWTTKPLVQVKAMLELFISKMIQKNKRKGILKEAAEYFTRPTENLHKEIFERLNSLSQGTNLPDPSNDENLNADLKEIINTHYKQAPPKIPPSPALPTDTESSSFLSILTSNTTLSTPEPIPTPEQTLSETIFIFVSNAVDKAVYLRVDEGFLNYDTAYIELSKAVEKAMEVPVIEIRKDIAKLYENAYEMFEFNIMEKERIAAEIAWEKRMRKKMKKTLRRLDDFKGYVTPPTPKSVISSHDSYKIPPPRPCVCHPKCTYNRYPKDRFGVYLPSQKKFSIGNVTVSPDISESSADERSDHAEAAT